MKVYLFGWPGTIGGAETKFTHLLGLLRPHYSITVVPPDSGRLREKHWINWLDEMSIPYCAMGKLPRRLGGWGVTLCNSEFLGSADWVDIRRRGLRMAWGNEMMWMLPREAGAITLGQIDAVLYVSPMQRAALEPQYGRQLRGSLITETPDMGKGGTSGWIAGDDHGNGMRWVMVGNYVDPAAYPFRERINQSKTRLVVGRLSRPDPTKFPADFPRSYEELGLDDPLFRVMGWNPAVQTLWPKHRFDERWDLLRPSPNTVDFLQSLDLFVYDVGPRCRESWGRAVVEAMLTGAIPLLPRGGGHHLENLIEHRRSGFLCRNRQDFSRYAKYIQDHPNVRQRMSRSCREHAVQRLCNARHHLRLWHELFHGG